jgi:hypothetical protein
VIIPEGEPVQLRLAIRQRLLSDDNSESHYAPASEIDRATSWAHSTQGALWPLSRELPRGGREHGLLRGRSKTPLTPPLRWLVSTSCELERNSLGP